MLIVLFTFIFVNSILWEVVVHAICRYAQLLCNLQNAPRSFEIAHVQFANFWPKPDSDPNTNANFNYSEIVQHISQIVQTQKLRATVLLIHCRCLNVCAVNFVILFVTAICAGPASGSSDPQPVRCRQCTGARPSDGGEVNIIREAGCQLDGSAASRM